MEDLSCIRFRKLKKNKSDEDPKVLRKALRNSKQSSHFYHDEREPIKNRQSYPGPLRSFPHPHNTTLSTSVKSLPSSPPSHVPFHNRLLGKAGFTSIQFQMKLFRRLVSLKATRRNPTTFPTWNEPLWVFTFVTTNAPSFPGLPWQTGVPPSMWLFKWDHTNGHHPARWPGSQPSGCPRS